MTRRTKLILASIPAFFLIAVLSALAQNSAVFPTKTATTSDLFTASNNYASALSLGVNSTATTLTVPSTSGFAAPGLVSINSEVIAVCAVASGTTLTVGHSACPNVDGRGYDGTSAAAHISGQAVQGRINAWLHNQAAAEIMALENFIVNNAGTTYPEFYGAKCDGSTDDSASVQNAVNAAISIGARLFFRSMCAVSRMIYVPYTHAGLILEGSTSITGTGGTHGAGLKAVTNSGFDLLHIYAQNVTLKNFYANCNSLAAHGIVFSSATEATANNARASFCTDDGVQINGSATPTTTTTSNFNAGSGSNRTFTVSTTALTGITLGGTNCTDLYLDYGSSGDIIAGTSSGQTITTSSTTTHNHNSGSIVQCAGQNNGIKLPDLTSNNNGGWGLNIFYSGNVNGIRIGPIDLYSNTLGGMLGSGTANSVAAGWHSEANAGPAIQLGDIDGSASSMAGRQARAWRIGEPGDLENTLPAYNAVSSVCSTGSIIHFGDPSQFLPASLLNTCPLYNTNGIGDLGIGLGTDGAGALLAIKTFRGTILNSPGNTVLSGYTQYLDASSTVTNTITSDAGVGTTYAGGNLVANGALNQINGNLNVTGSTFLQKTPNYKAVECIGSGNPVAQCAAASANNLLVVGWTDQNGNAVTPADGMRMTLNGLHTLQAGANTIQVNSLSAVHIYSAALAADLASIVGPNGLFDLVYRTAPATAWYLENVK